MLKIDKKNKKLIALDKTTMRDAGYWERRDIQAMICKCPDQFCEELGEYIHIVGSEICPADIVRDRIDILGVDPDGTAVVIELKRDGHKLHLLQAIAYASMIAKWQPRQFVEALSQYCQDHFPEQSSQTFQQSKEQLEDILEDGDTESINRNQRIVLLAEHFDYEVLVTAEWLTEKYEMDVRCYRISLAKIGEDEFLTCTSVYPPPELTEVAVRRRRGGTNLTAANSTWDDIMKSISNESERMFVQRELSVQRQNNVERAYFTYRREGKRMFLVGIKRQFASVVQFGRFDGDQSFWKGKLNEKESVRPRQHDRYLRFRLTSDSDFKVFSGLWEAKFLNTTAFDLVEGDGDAIESDIET